MVSFSYDRGTRSMMGVKPKDVMKKYSEMGATLVGANCGTTLENMEAVVKEYAATVPDFPLWVKPNAGVPHMDIETEQGVYDMGPGGYGGLRQEICGVGCEGGRRMLREYPRAHRRDCESGEELRKKQERALLFSFL